MSRDNEPSATLTLVVGVWITRALRLRHGHKNAGHDTPALWQRAVGYSFGLTPPWPAFLCLFR